MSDKEHNEPTPPEGEAPGDWTKEQIHELATEAMNTPLAVNLLSRELSNKVLFEKEAEGDLDHWRRIAQALPDYPDKGQKVAKGILDEMDDDEKREMTEAVERLVSSLCARAADELGATWATLTPDAAPPYELSFRLPEVVVLLASTLALGHTLNCNTYPAAE